MTDFVQNVKNMSCSCHEKFITPLTGGVTVMSPVFIFMPQMVPTVCSFNFLYLSWSAMTLLAKVLIRWIMLFVWLRCMKHKR